MVLIEQTDIKYIESIIDLVKMNESVLALNNKMIYYLCCTLFKGSSFIAIENEKTIGLIFAFPDLLQKNIWIHQLAVNPNKKRQGIGSKLIRRLELLISGKKLSFNQMQLMVKPDNQVAKKFYLKHGFSYSYLDTVMNMEIWCKEIIRIE